MKVQLLLSAAAGFCGALLAMALFIDSPQAPLAAQEPPRPPASAGNAFPGYPPAPLPPPGVAAWPGSSAAASGALAAGPHGLGQALPVDVEDYTPEERVNISVYENVNRSVVNITTKGSAGTALFVFDIPAEGAGSGAVLDKRGHILTNYHVVEGARDIRVTLFDRNTYEARLVGRDPASDVAVIRIDAPADVLFPVRFGDSSRLRVGQRVFALGNPFGLERTLTTGIISSLNRELPSRNSRVIKSVIQIDAAINPGNSGGPLLDSHSRLIGMNTAIASTTGQNTGVGFAIPSNTIARVVPQLIEKGKVVRPDVGISRVYQMENGLLIATLVPGGPAERAGLQGVRVVRERRRRGPFVYEYETVDRSTADLIVGVDGEPVATADDFLSLIEAKRPGDEVVLKILRAGKELHVRLRLAEGES